MDDPNITMEEYIRLEEEKARRRGKVYNWETATYVFNDTLTSEARLSCEPTVSSLNNEIDFRISFDESDDEDYTVIFDKNSFSYKIKMDSENDNEKVMPSIPSPEPAISCFDDLDFFKDFENEFPAIVYNDAQTSKSDLLTEPILNPQHIDEFDLKSETSLSKCDEEEQIVLNFNDLFPFNVIYPKDSKSSKDNDDGKVDINTIPSWIYLSTVPDIINADDVPSTWCINTAYPGEWKRRIDFLYSFRTLGKLSTKLVKVSTSLKCWSLETSRRLFNTNYCS
ncbi:hypothetical protein Tco_0702366 [Tanacetum coccineum]|uniref:Uncharacterized protein n=1 Tax=Tanacetum coccineum TaxID=301880 RepID=A0ABQ4XVR0_9ASTR